MHRPGDEVHRVGDPMKDAHWYDLIDLAKAQDQFDSLVELYESHGVEVLALEPGDAASPNHFFMRDLFTMTPEGAILGRPASMVRAGEEVAVARCLAKNRIPILHTVSGASAFEGPDLVFADPEVAFVATGIRTNAAGADQVTGVLQRLGIRVVRVQSTYGCGHLDGVLSIVDHRKAVVFPTRVSHVVVDRLRDLGYSIISLPDVAEGGAGMATNMVALEPGRVIIPAGCPETVSMLRDIGVEAISIDLSELMKGGGAVHCMTGIVWRKTRD